MITLETSVGSTTVTGPGLSTDSRYYVAAKAACAAQLLAGQAFVFSGQLNSGPIMQGDDRARAIENYLRAGESFSSAIDFAPVKDLDFLRANALPGSGTDLSNGLRAGFVCVWTDCFNGVNQAPNYPCQTNLPAPALPDVIPAPEWLKGRRRALQHKPRPSLEDVQTYFKTSAALQRRFVDKRTS